jgi:hypothetical protein
VRTKRNTQISCVGRVQSSAIYTNPVRTSQETHYVSNIEPNQLILFGEIVAVYCEDRTEHTDTLCGQNAEFCNIYISRPYLTGNTIRLHYRAQPFNAVWGNSRCLLWEPYRTQTHCVGRMQTSAMYTNPVRTSQKTYYVSSAELNLLMPFGETVAA